MLCLVVYIIFTTTSMISRIVLLNLYRGNKQERGILGSLSWENSEYNIFKLRQKDIYLFYAQFVNKLELHSYCM